MFVFLTAVLTVAPAIAFTAYDRVSVCLSVCLSLRAKTEELLIY